MKILLSIIFVTLALGCTGAAEPASVSTQEHKTPDNTDPIIPPSVREDVPGRLVSIQEFGVLPTNTPAQNKENLQKAIEEAHAAGLALYVTPVENGYPIDGGIELLRNVSLVGAHGPTGRGTANPDRSGPTGSVFVIRDKENVFLSVQSATTVRGIQFYYPDQTWDNPDKIIPYPPTIQGSRKAGPQGVTLKDLTFYGEYMAMDFRMPAPSACEQILFENCYGYPLSGEFIAISRCYDIPRVLHCHVNPANQREFGRHITAAMVDKVVENKTYAYSIDATDNAVLMDVFTFGTYRGVYLGPATYGQLTSFNLDCVAIGIFRTDDGSANRNWEISQGSIIANLGTDVRDIHPVWVEGVAGHTSLANVNCFSGKNGGNNSIGQSYDFLHVAGSGMVTVSMVSCRMMSYVADDPVVCTNSEATIRAVACFDRDGVLYERIISPDSHAISGSKTVFDACDEALGWSSALGTASLDSGDKKEGAGSVSVTGSRGNVLFSRLLNKPVSTTVSRRKGHLHLWLYISDIAALDTKAEGALEVTSSGKPDVCEAAWYLSGLNLKSGWNEIDLKLSGAGLSGGTPDLQAMNFLRIYSLGVKSKLTVKIDDVYFWEE